MNQPAFVEDAPYELETQTLPDLVTIDASTGEIEPDEDQPEDNEENRAILARVEERKKNIATEWWYLAEDLYLVKEKNLHKLAGYKNIEDYFPQVVDNSYRYAFQLCQMYSYFNIELAALLPDKPEVYQDLIDKVKKLGVTKTKEIAGARIKDPDVLIQMVDSVIEPNEKGQIKSVSEIKAMIDIYKDSLRATPGTDEFDKDSKQKERKELSRKEVFKFTLMPGDAEKVKEAIATAQTWFKVEDNEKSQSQAFFRICEEWSIEKQASIEGTRPGVDADLKRLEEIYNIKIIAFQADERGFLAKNIVLDDGEEGAKVLFGESTLNDLVDQEDADPVSEPEQALA